MSIARAGRTGFEPLDGPGRDRDLIERRQDHLRWLTCAEDLWLVRRHRLDVDGDRPPQETLEVYDYTTDPPRLTAGFTTQPGAVIGNAHETACGLGEAAALLVLSDLDDDGSSAIVVHWARDP